MALPESSTLILGRYLTKHCSLSSAGIPCSSFSLLSLGQCLTELFRTFSSSPPRSSQEPPQTRAPSRIPPWGFSRFQKASAARNNQNVAGTSDVLEPPSLSASASPLLPWCRRQPSAKPSATNAPLQKRAAAFVLSQFVSLSPSLVLLRKAVMILPLLHSASFTSQLCSQVRRYLALARKR